MYCYRQVDAIITGCLLVEGHNSPTSLLIVVIDKLRFVDAQHAYYIIPTS